MKAGSKSHACFLVLSVICQYNMSLGETLMAKGINKFSVLHTDGYPPSSVLKTFSSIPDSSLCLLACNLDEKCWGFAYHVSRKLCLLFGKDNYFSEKKKTVLGYTYYAVSSWAPLKGKYSAMQSGISDASPDLALDDVKCPAELPKFTPNCAMTDYISDSKKPWVELDLQEPFAIVAIDLIGSESIPIHDLEIRVGNTSVQSTPRDEHISVNQKCALRKKHQAGVKNTINCNRAVGQILSFQIIDNCTDKDYCGHLPGNILGVCEVAINSYVCNTNDFDDTFKVITLLTSIGSTVHHWCKCESDEQSSKSQSVKQSSQVGSNGPSKALDGKKDTYIQTAADMRYPWWQLDLGKNVYIVQVEIYNRIDNYSARFHDVELRASKTDFTENLGAEQLFPDDPESVCKTNIGTDTVFTDKTIVCNAFARYVGLQIVRNCTNNCLEGEEGQHILNVAEIKVFGFSEARERSPKSSNFDFSPVEIQAAQSTTWRDFGPEKILKSLSSNGILSFSGKNIAILTGGSLTPWWRVDLGRLQPVHGALIYNWGVENLTFLHNFEIRVGTADIADGNFNNVVFEGNPLCAKKIGPMVKPGKSTHMCKKSLNGRYVSIQIVAPGQQEFSLLPSSNILSFCEVSIIGDGKN